MPKVYQSNQVAFPEGWSFVLQDSAPSETRWPSTQHPMENFVARLEQANMAQQDDGSEPCKILINLHCADTASG